MCDVENCENKSTKKVKISAFISIFKKDVIKDVNLCEEHWRAFESGTRQQGSMGCIIPEEGS